MASIIPVRGAPVAPSKKATCQPCSAQYVFSASFARGLGCARLCEGAHAAAGPLGFCRRRAALPGQSGFLPRGEFDGHGRKSSTISGLRLRLI
jgi:hypothetical protein